jgi:hypothetical protein
MGTRRDFTSGKSANNVRSLNTAIGHLETLQKAAQGLDNSSVPMWNRVANAIESGTGDPRVVRFVTAANAVENELAALFKGTGATDQEIKEWRRAFNENMSPEQLKASTSQAVELMGSRLLALRDQYEKSMGKPADFGFLNAKSRSVLKEMGVDVDALEPSRQPAQVPSATPADSSAATAATNPAAQPFTQRTTPSGRTIPEPLSSHGRPSAVYNGKDESGSTPASGSPKDGEERPLPNGAGTAVYSAATKKWTVKAIRASGAPSAPAAPTSGGTVRMRAPNGQIQDVPADQVAHYTALGASVVR